MPTFVTRYLHHHKFIGRITDFAVNRTGDWPDYRHQLSAEIHRVQKTVHIGINATARRFSQRRSGSAVQWYGGNFQAGFPLLVLYRNHFAAKACLLTNVQLRRTHHPN